MLTTGADIALPTIEPNFGALPRPTGAPMATVGAGAPPAACGTDTIVASASSPARVAMRIPRGRDAKAGRGISTVCLVASRRGQHRPATAKLGLKPRECCDVPCGVTADVPAGGGEDLGAVHG